VDPHELKEMLLDRALDHAGIERASWRPALGVEANRRTVEAVYAYYGQLFLEHPYLEWAGMASMVGPAFFAGFSDIGFLPDALRRSLNAVFGRLPRSLARRSTGDLGFYETTFLQMQKKIFEDQAPMHEAYLSDGLSQIEELYRARIIDVATLEAWRQIDAGRDRDAVLVNCGNRTLLLREQFDIIDRFYVRMLRYRWPEGPAFTYTMTLTGAPSIPGAHSFPVRYPRTFVLSLPRAVIRVRTPLADGNIAVFADRWKLIDEDTLPEYLAFVRDRADEARALVATPISQRTPGYRLLARAGRLAIAAFTRWDLDVGAVPDREEALAVRFVEPHAAGEVGGTMFDLTSAPTRESAGFAAESDSRVWMAPDRRPFDSVVALPGGRVFRARTTMALMLSSTRAGDPDRLTVQAPSAGLEAIEQVVAQYAEEWGFPVDAVAGWRTGAERRASSDRDYSTHVFTADDVGFVHLEFQVSHHVREGDFVIAALFSWTSRVA
jgi:hypothetical protein